MEGFKGLFTSGNCNTQGQVGSNANQFKQFMGSMNQTTPQLGKIQHTQANQNLDQLIQNFDKIWLTEQNSFQQEIAKRQQKAPLQTAPAKPMRAWNADFVSPNFLAMQQQTTQLLMEPQAPVRKCPFQSVKFENVKIQEEPKQREKEKKLEQKEGLESARALIEMMEKDGSAKFKESDFLRFLKKIDREEVKIEDNRLIEAQPESVEKLVEQNFEKAFAEAEEEFVKEQKETTSKQFD